MNGIRPEADNRVQNDSDCIVEDLPCTAAQRHLWVMQRLDSGNPASNIALRWQLDGALPNQELERALTDLVERHSALGAFIVEREGQPLQRLECRPVCRLGVIDLGDMAEVEASERAGQLAELEARLPFDLSVPPLLRLTRLRFSERRSHLLLTVNAMICDRRSAQRLAQELLQLCLCVELPIDPQKSSWLATPDQLAVAADEAYWLRTLSGLPHFELYPDHARPSVQTWQSGIRYQRVEADLLARLQAMAQHQGCSLATITLAALLLLLNRYSGEADITVGCQFDSPLDDKTDDAIDGTTAAAIGPGAGVLLLRGDLSGDPGFIELLQQIHQRLQDGKRHSGVSVERLLALLAPPRDLSRNALYSVHFGCHQRPLAQFNNAGQARLRLTELPSCAAGSRHDLGFALNEQDGGWWLSCEFNSALFEPATADRLLGHLVRLLSSIVADPCRNIAGLAMLDDAERQALIAAGNGTEADYPRQQTVCSLFGEQARLRPDSIALICGERGLDYRALVAASDDLAARLRRRGIGPGSRVAVFLERSPDLLVALLAVLATGAAYVPLDPRYPMLRLAQIVADAGLALVLSRQALLARLPANAAEVLAVDAPKDAAGQAHDGPPSRPGPDDIAYLIYTSGSTGRPKGVPISHRALCNLLWSMRHEPGLDAGERLLAVTTVSFDIAALELFLPLIVGATVILAQDQDTADGEVLRGLLERHQVTLMQATPVSWQLLLAAGWQAAPGFRMLCGGEALPRQLADRLMEGGGELWNLYGPTETTIWSSALRVTTAPSGLPSVPPSAPTSVAIGPPIANTRFHVLDERGELTPPATPGELYIGGDGLAPGYLNLPELNAQRFVADPFRPGSRLYRTGDWVRRRDDGSFDFLGRADRQIKLRGFRIELGDLEAALLAQPGIADCVAVVAPDASGTGVLMACVVADPPAPSGFADTLQAALRLSLPAYLCPASLIVLERLPRMPNGKIDRARLPAPAAQLEPEPATSSAAPTTTEDGSLELRLTRLWCSLLGLATVGRDVNFFEIGGHSLLAVQLLARIEAEFGTRLSLASLFSSPTVVGQLALLAQGDSRAFDFRQVVRLQTQGGRPPLIALNNTGIYYGLSKHLGPDQPFISLQLFDPALPQATLPQTLTDIAGRYAELILRVQPTGPYHLLGWCVAGTLAFEVARQLQASGHSIGRLILFDTWAPHYLERLPWPRSLLADYAFRWQLISADWARAQASEHRWATFIGNRSSFRKLRRWLGGRPEARTEPMVAGLPLSSRQYDRWLLEYLEAAVAAFEPQRYAGDMVLFRSSQEPSGRFLDPQMGWATFVEAGVTVVVVDGDHFSVFQEPGVKRLAQVIETMLATVPAR
ncbi:amino acid adenylation domain-containing protein [uncultured Nevskia sp.]|uniref:non-ribosomal peptide synthetase n=1 Tax=uncultured Nevskia sp. TaxID=228950 RepID=UPI0025EE1933|nr:amino acid adenylation domain-containing protein [uncultured Nevskia sp.]